MTDAPKPRVLIIALGFAGRRLAQSFSERYNTRVTNGSATWLHKDGRWRITHTDSTLAFTHIIIAASTDDDGDQMADLQRVVNGFRSLFMPSQDCTIVLASPVSEVGTTRKLLGFLHCFGRKVGIAPQFEVWKRGEPLMDPLPKVIAGIDDESTASLRDLYGQLYGFENLIVLPEMETVEEFKSHQMLLQYLNSVRVDGQLASACQGLQIDSGTSGVEEAAAWCNEDQHDPSPEGNEHGKDEDKLMTE